MKEKIVNVLDQLFQKLENNNLRVLDAAMGGGNVTLELAQRTNGKVISVDIDPADSATKKIEDANLSSPVEVVKGTLASMDFLQDSSIDTIVSHSTISSIPAETPFKVQQVFKEFFRVLNPGGILLIIDYYPLESAAVRTKADEIAQDAWRTYKAVAELVGDHHHEEVPPEWVCETLRDTGFKDVYHEKISERELSDTFEEYIENMLHYISNIEDDELSRAFRMKILKLERDARMYGKSEYSSTYCIWATK
ncbi:MAG: methyltransferase domain-containing protein [Theionarchaea archaeon]|nr:methyltransferase domain-containing protein [Theionarchaea archaeon]MBU7000432.1 methyltransferase domain-containing protein [Theionarchaea archaeon]MBU7021275.1 methyltransferase domain-containing protein [Theionarchaea archaeon]MBU7036046.1 methyltransferase domain-containing protein [Theionarchaea archaeon]MBU7039766.1 methyltransferase domain-containing protein [Theionarchaea archaeon]